MGVVEKWRRIFGEERGGEEKIARRGISFSNVTQKGEMLYLYVCVYLECTCHTYLSNVL